jgi:hypothetical protein
MMIRARVQIDCAQIRHNGKHWIAAAGGLYVINHRA